MIMDFVKTRIGDLCECTDPWRAHWGFRWEPPADGRKHRPTEEVLDVEPDNPNDPALD